MIEYLDEIELISETQLEGFFVGWKKPLSSRQHLELLKGSSHFIVAIEVDKVVGFITALSDGVNSSFIPLLEVLPKYQRKGIGTELVKRMLIKLEGISNVDLMCDEEILTFYDRFSEMCRAKGMIIRK